MKKATQQHTKRHNRDLVLGTVFGNATVSRAEIARITGLTRTTVSQIVAGLMDEGLVQEVGVGSSRGGKSPILLSVVADSRHLIGLDLAQDRFSGALVNLRGEIRQTLDLPVPSGDGDAALGAVYQLLDGLIAAATRPLVGIGVGTPGLVDARHGVVVNAVNLNWRNLPARPAPDRPLRPARLGAERQPGGGDRRAHVRRRLPPGREPRGRERRPRDRRRHHPQRAAVPRRRRRSRRDRARGGLRRGRAALPLRQRRLSRDPRQHPRPRRARARRPTRRREAPTPRAPRRSPSIRWCGISRRPTRSRARSCSTPAASWAWPSRA